MLDGRSARSALLRARRQQKGLTDGLGLAFTRVSRRLCHRFLASGAQGADAIEAVPGRGNRTLIA